MHIAIAGNIGSGKTTLAKMLAKDITGRLVSNPLNTIPILMTSIRTCRAGSFNLQIYFLNKRFKEGGGNQPERQGHHSGPHHL